MRKIFKHFPDKAKELERKPFMQEAYLEGFLLDNIKAAFELYDLDEIRLLDRQVVLPGSNKKIDILLLNNKDEPELIIVEIKKGIADEPALRQLLDYLNIWERDHQKIIGFNDEAEKALRELGVKRQPAKAKGILVASEFEPNLEKTMSEKEIQGIEINKYIVPESGESFIFLDYVPALKGKRQRTPISKEEFWDQFKKYVNYKDGIENIIEKMQAADAGIHLKYFKSGMGIYPSSEILIGWWDGRSFYAKTVIKPAKWEKVVWDDDEKIVELLLSVKKKADEE